MKEINLNLLNNSQLTALKQIEGPVMVTAGAGSGKTRLVTFRIAYLIKNLHILPENILAITFTNKAANEMSSRLFNMVEGADRVWISTFHSMCTKILRKHISSLKSAKNLTNFDSNFSIYTDTDKEKALKKVLQNLGLDKEGFLTKADYHISNAKNNNLSPWDYQKQNQATFDIKNITLAYSAYQNFLANNNALDFDDLLIKTYELFIEFPDILKRYQNKFEYIHIDEFQDTNHVQYQLAKLLAGKHKNIFVVGDEDQCIYSWRGANIQNIKDFKTDFPDLKIFKLEQNYRSTKSILNIANKLIKNNFSRNDKILWTENSLGLDVEYYKAKDEFDEAEYVVKKIKSLVLDEKYLYSDIAVLLRLNAMTAPFEEKLLNYNLPYKVFGGNKFFERMEIKNLIAYLKLLTNPYDSTSFTRIINFPKRGIGEATIKNILKLSEFHNTTPVSLILNSEEYLIDKAIEKKIKPFKDIIASLFQNIRKLEPYAFIDYLVRTVDFKSIYNSNTEEDLSRLLNIDSFLVLAQEFFKRNTKCSVSEFLQSIMLVSDIDNYDDKNNSITLATVHSVKGLEFKVVFVVGLEEKIFPIIRSYTSIENLEEERRLMFVAITRAKNRLFLLNTKSRFVYGKRNYLLPSRFLNECEVTSSGVLNTFNSNISNRSFQSFSKMKFSLKNDNKPSLKNLEKKFSVGTKVSHPKFGQGVITNNHGINVTKCVSISFNDFGIKTLSVDYAPITVVKEEKDVGK